MRRGLILGATAYLLWGLFPLYFPLLQPAGALEVLAHRMVWSLLVSAVVLTVVRGWRHIRQMPAKVWLLVLAGASLIAVNWGIYIWAVNADHVVDAALGYFINPLVTVLFGVLIFRERLRVDEERLEAHDARHGALALPHFHDDRDWLRCAFPAPALVQSQSNSGARTAR